VRRLKIPAAAASLVRGLHPDLKRKFRAALDQILEDRSVGKALKEELAGLRSYRVGRLRVIFRSAAGDVIELVVVGPRSTIYEETLRLLRKQAAARSASPGRERSPASPAPDQLSLA
jgi:mRNA interferase RelE/StbE